MIRLRKKTAYRRYFPCIRVALAGVLLATFFLTAFHVHPARAAHDQEKQPCAACMLGNQNAIDHQESTHPAPVFAESLPLVEPVDFLPEDSILWEAAPRAPPTQSY